MFTRNQKYICFLNRKVSVLVTRKVSVLVTTSNKERLHSIINASEHPCLWQSTFLSHAVSSNFALHTIPVLGTTDKQNIIQVRQTECIFHDLTLHKSNTRPAKINVSKRLFLETSRDSIHFKPRNLNTHINPENAESVKNVHLLAKIYNAHP